MPKFRVIFSNLTGCAIGISDYYWSVVIEAPTDDEAKKIGISYAEELSRTTGFPPHGLRLGEFEINKAVVLPE